MNVEMFFVRTMDRDGLLRCVEERLRSPADQPNAQPDWGLESSYDVLVAADPKRKVAVSPVVDGWVAVVESKEVLDFRLLQGISAQLSAEVLACQLGEVTDSFCYARCIAGKVVEHSVRADLPDAFAAARHLLRQHSIPHDIVTFREAVQLRSTGWQILSKSA